MSSRDMTYARHGIRNCTELGRELTAERDFWKQRYDTQHETVHRLEDEIARLRGLLVMSADEIENLEDALRSEQDYTSMALEDCE